MKLTTIDSGSYGNCYILESYGSKIMIECGIDFNYIQKALDYDFDNFELCLISHSHKDHCKAEKEVAQIMPIIKESFENDNWKVKAFTKGLQHDVPVTGFYIESKIEKKKVAFVTDTGVCGYTFKNADVIMLEANYNRENLTGEDYESRTIHNHLSLSKFLEVVEKSNSKHKTIIPIHMSNSRLDWKLLFSKTRELSDNVVNVFEHTEIEI